MKSAQYIIRSVTVSAPQGSWRWQKRGVKRLFAVDPLNPTVDPRCKHAVVLSERRGALGVTSASRYAIEPFTRSDAEQHARKIGFELMPHIGGEFGPWITKTNTR